MSEETTVHMVRRSADVNKQTNKLLNTYKKNIKPCNLNAMLFVSGDSIIVHAPVDPSIPQGRRRKKRTSIDQKRRGVLDDMFNKVKLLTAC